MENPWQGWLTMMKSSWVISECMKRIVSFRAFARTKARSS